MRHGQSVYKKLATTTLCTRNLLSVFRNRRIKAYLYNTRYTLSYTIVILAYDNKCWCLIFAHLLIAKFEIGRFNVTFIRSHIRQGMYTKNRTQKIVLCGQTFVWNKTFHDVSLHFMIQFPAQQILLSRTKRKCYVKEKSAKLNRLGYFK